MALIPRARSLQRQASPESGQSLVEYILLLSVLVMVFIGLQKMFASTNIFSILTKTIQKDFAHAYRYGDIRALGPDEGGWAFHPLADPGAFRIFFNPGKKK